MWKKVKLGKIISIEYGKGLPQRERKDGNVPVVGSNGIVGYHNKAMVKGPGIVIGRKGTIGAISWIDTDFWPIDTTYYVKLKRKDICLRWLFFKLTYLNLKKLHLADVVPGLKRDLVYSIKIPLPPLPEQKAIAKILSTVDEAIQKVDEAIAKTERLKKGLMHKLLTKGIGHKEFKYSKELGCEIPKEWEVVKLREITRIERGKFAHRPRNDPRFYDGKIPFIQTGDISNSNGIIKKYYQTLNEEGLKISKLFKKGTIVISIAGNIGDVGILDFDACFPDSVVGITGDRNRVDNLFLMYTLQKFKYKLSSIAPRSTQKNVNLQILEPFKIPLPPLPEQQKIAEILSTVDKKLELERERKEKLERIKKGLMNDLLTGRKRVNVEKVLGKGG
ncbi:MAG: restriction endonuclease subunit S [Thermoplasmata archaeon]|nr:restriction endonuclease subunit S [Thermoplasmata archaeon]